MSINHISADKIARRNRLMILSRNLLISFLVYHFFICTIASFITWEVCYFNMSDWKEGSRFFYSIGFFLSIAIGLAVTFEGKQ